MLYLSVQALRVLPILGDPLQGLTRPQVSPCKRKRADGRMREKRRMGDTYLCSSMKEVGTNVNSLMIWIRGRYSPQGFWGSLSHWSGWAIHIHKWLYGQMYRYSSPKNENSVINYSPWCRSKPVRPSLIFRTQIKIFLWSCNPCCLWRVRELSEIS